MSNMDVWRGLRWVSTSFVMLWRHFHSSSGPDRPNLGATRPIKQYKGATVCPWDSIPMLKTLYICLIWMCEEVWGGYQPQLWRYDVIFTPQMVLTYQIWGQLGPCNSTRVQPYALETTYQCFKYLYMSTMDVWRGLRWVSTSIGMLWRHFYSSSTKSGDNLARVTVQGCNHMHLRQHTNA
jgi:hypothetical protein